MADRGNQRIQIFDANGAHLDTWPNLRFPNHVVAAPDGTVWTDQRAVAALRRQRQAASGARAACIPALWNCTSSLSTAKAISTRQTARWPHAEVPPTRRRDQVAAGAVRLALPARDAVAPVTGVTAAVGSRHPLLSTMAPTRGGRQDAPPVHPITSFPRPAGRQVAVRPARVVQRIRLRNGCVVGPLRCRCDEEVGLDLFDLGVRRAMVVTDANRGRGPVETTLNALADAGVRRWCMTVCVGTNRRPSTTPIVRESARDRRFRRGVAARSSTRPKANLYDLSAGGLPRLRQCADRRAPAGAGPAEATDCDSNHGGNGLETTGVSIFDLTEMHYENRHRQSPS